jgi:hypothetical protein
MKPKLLNYTTSISPERTVAEIQQKLAQHGAHQILHEYDNNGNLMGLSFKIRTTFGELAFRLPANINAVQKVLVEQRVRGRFRPGDREQASKVAWRILKDWVEAQLALLQTGQVTVEQVFMAFIMDAKGRTLYEVMCAEKFAGLRLEAKTT